MPVAELMTLLVCVFALLLAVHCVAVVGLWNMFVKAGRPGWAAIIPLYRDTVRNNIAGVSVLWTYAEWVIYAGIIIGVYMTDMVLECVLIGWIARCICYVFTYTPLLKAYHRDTRVWYVISAVLFPYIIFPQIGMGKATYSGAHATASMPAQSDDQT